MHLRRATLAACLLPLLLLTATGCAKPYEANAFDGGPRPDAEVAKLTLDPEVRLISIDGKPLEGVPSELSTGGDYRNRLVRLLPGTHRIVVGMAANATTYNSPPPAPMQPGLSFGLGMSYTKRYPGSKENEELEFTVKPGRKYLVKLDNPPDLFTKEEKWSARVVDKTGPEFETLVSRSLGKSPHTFPPDNAK